MVESSLIMVYMMVIKSWLSTGDTVALLIFISSFPLKPQQINKCNQNYVGKQIIILAAH
jgi:hypothetical protein